MLVQCSHRSKPEKTVYPKQAEQTVKTRQVRILDKIPLYIQEVKNLTIFAGDSEPEYLIKLIPEQTFGKTGEPYLTTIRRCVVDDKGRVIIKNTDSNYKHTLYVYNTDGSYHIQLGRQGRGPGEYGFISRLYAKAGKVFVLDNTGQRLNEYSTKDYSFERSTLIEQWSIRNDPAVQGLHFGGIIPRNDGNYIASFFEQVSDTGRLIFKNLLMDSNGNKLDFEPLLFPSGLKVRVSKSMRPSGVLLFMGITTTALSDKDTLYSVWTRDFLIKKYDAKGVYQSAIYYPIEGLPFDLDASAKSNPFSPSAYDIKKAFDDMDKELPETNPVVASVKSSM